MCCICEDVGEAPPFTAYARLYLAVCFPPPAALPFVLVLPVLGIADTGLALDVVPPVVLGPFAGGPDLLAGDRTGVAADALVEVHHHRDLRANLHAFTPSSSRSMYLRFSDSGRSRQSISFILRTIDRKSTRLNSSH